MSPRRVLRTRCASRFLALALALALALPFSAATATIALADAAPPDEEAAAIEARRATFLARLSEGALAAAAEQVVRSGESDATAKVERASAARRTRIFFDTIDRELGAMRSVDAVDGEAGGHTWVGFTFREEDPTENEAEPTVAWYDVEFAYVGVLPIRVAATPDYVTSLRVGFPNADADARHLRRDVTRALFDAAEDAGL